MNAPHIAGRCALVVVLAVLVAGCSKSATGSSSSTANSSSESSASEIDSTPPAETTGPESPQPSQNGGPAISVASLPIGGTPTVQGAQQCGDVNWLGKQPIPAGVVVSIEAINLNPTGIFEFGGDACGSDRPRCTTSWSWTSDNTAGCSVPVIQVAAPESDQEVTLVLSGTVHCAELSMCQQAIKDSGGSTVAFVAEPGVVSSNSGSSESSSGSVDSGSTESSSSSSESSAGS